MSRYTDDPLFRVDAELVLNSLHETSLYRRSSPPVQCDLVERIILIMLGQEPRWAPRPQKMIHWKTPGSTSKEAKPVRNPLTGRILYFHEEETGEVFAHLLRNLYPSAEFSIGVHQKGEPR